METEAFEETMERDDASSDSDDPTRRHAHPSTQTHTHTRTHAHPCVYTYTRTQAKLYGELGYDEIDELWLKQQVHAWERGKDSSLLNSVYRKHKKNYSCK